jgi:hypothetical protein
MLGIMLARVRARYRSATHIGRKKLPFEALAFRDIADDKDVGSSRVPGRRSAGRVDVEGEALHTCLFEKYCL